ncbi:hypothetical protein N7475_009340 [Penicillium sp. IBT 31633x]|nr:hypothetical protein N7475_009340 [Penicillium sp. IBT 31633x]
MFWPINPQQQLFNLHHQARMLLRYSRNHTPSQAQQAAVNPVPPTKQAQAHVAAYQLLIPLAISLSRARP